MAIARGVGLEQFKTECPLLTSFNVNSPCRVDEELLEGGLSVSTEKCVIDAEMIRQWVASLAPLDLSDDAPGGDTVDEALKDCMTRCKHEMKDVHP